MKAMIFGTALFLGGAIILSASIIASSPAGNIGIILGICGGIIMFGEAYKPYLKKSSEEEPPNDPEKKRQPLKPSFSRTRTFH